MAAMSVTVVMNCSSVDAGRPGFEPEVGRGYRAIYD